MNSKYFYLKFKYFSLNNVRIMAYNIQLADKIRQLLQAFPKLRIKEKKMFGGLAFMVNDKMCMCVSGENLMCRFDPGIQDAIEKKKGYMPMMMKGKELKGYCYIAPEGFKRKKDFEYFMSTCLEYNKAAKASKKK